jgi:hypothetical protein
MMRRKGATMSSVLESDRVCIEIRDASGKVTHVSDPRDRKEQEAMAEYHRRHRANGEVVSLVPPTGKRLIAEKLTQWASAAASEGFQVRYAAGMFFDDDPESADHLFSVWAGNAEEAETGTLDDRSDVPMERQIVSEMRRISQWWSDMAARIEARIVDQEEKDITLADTALT